jgi:hypothetical protein
VCGVREALGKVEMAGAHPGGIAAWRCREAATRRSIEAATRWSIEAATRFRWTTSADESPWSTEE